MGTVEVFDAGKPSGLSTDRELKILNDRWPTLTRGQEITHDEILAALSMRDRHSSRYRTVTDRWRRYLLRERNLVVEAVKNTGFRVLNEPERIEHARRRKATGQAQIRRGYRVLATTDEKLLDSGQRADLDHELRSAQALAQFLTAQRKEAPALPPAVSSAG